MSPFSRRIVRVGVTLTATGLLVLAGPGIASAHVTAHSPDGATKGGDAAIVFRVPNEDDTAHTTKVEVTFSTTSPISNADILPVPGWTADVQMGKLPKPVNMNNSTVTDAVRTITWTANPGAGINPGEYKEFDISVEGLPDNTNTLVMPTTQTYDNGKVVTWDQPTVAGQAEPEHPAPTLALAASEGDSADSSKPAAAAAALALGIGLGGFLRGRRSRGASA
jgi:uncharacterized protein YcnI